MLDTGAYFEQLSQLVRALPQADVDNLERLLRAAWRDGHTIFLLGNGGSAATASHLACDLGKSLVAPDRPRPHVLSLTDNVSMLTAYANDISYECVFAEQLAGLVRAGDLVLAISGSGNSPNVVAAVTTANALGAITFGLTGFEGGKLAGVTTHSLIVPSDNMQLIEDAHLVIGHAVFVALRDGDFAGAAR
jgi:D-sedoheptulose 7-phosphate isomerase